MHAYSFFLGLIFLNWLGQVITPTPEPLSINSPLPGSALQGQVVIQGNTDIPGFQISELWFSYPDGSGEFLIGQQRQPIRSGDLGIWDTTVINDGNYDLNLRVYLTDGTILQVSAGGLRVRNSSPIETNTPEVDDSPALVSPTALSPTITARPTATRLPQNPAAIQQADLGAGILAGAVGVIGGFVLLGLYLGLRRLMRRP